jgi:hypothetical protein
MDPGEQVRAPGVAKYDHYLPLAIFTVRGRERAALIVSLTNDAERGQFPSGRNRNNGMGRCSLSAWPGESHLVGAESRTNWGCLVQRLFETQYTTQTAEKGIGFFPDAECVALLVLPVRTATVHP